MWLAAASLLVATTACGGDTERGESVQNFMESAGPVEWITVSDMYDRAVSEIVIVCPYTTESLIKDELGFNWPGAKSLARSLIDDSKQAVIAMHDGHVVELEVMDYDVLHLCAMDVPNPTTLGGDTVLQVSPSTDVLAGTTYPVASIR